MDIHRNAKAAPLGRRLMVPRLADGRPMARVAAAFGVTPRTVGTWQARPWEFLHARVDAAASRRAATEILPGERQERAVVAVLKRARPGAPAGAPPSRGS